MSFQNQIDGSWKPTNVTPGISPHPLDPLSSKEIVLAASILRNAKSSEKIIFRVITLSEPPKAQLLPYLEAERAGKPCSPLPRIAMIQFYVTTPKNFRQIYADLSNQTLHGEEELKGRHSYVDAEELEECEENCLADGRVKVAIQSLDLPEEAVVCVEPWTYGTDGMHDMSNRVVLCFFYMRLGNHADSNHYAYPLNVIAEMDGATRKVMKVLTLPTGDDDRMREGGVKKFDRRKLHETSEYHPDKVDFEHRTSLKPLRVVQPEGPSFQTEGNLLTWEKWRMRVGFNYREGLTLHDISYDNRPLFYRLSLVEMFVPYGDARAPYPRKAAFDLGNNGAGVNANNLGLGCDCLGHIKYFDAWHHTTDGTPIRMPNVICCHEVDDGILWKHMNYRTNNACVARSRTLVLQTIITVTNYEYIFSFHFLQDASLFYEVRATGILSTAPIDLTTTHNPSGTIVAPGVMAPYHQHLFSLRIDPMLDGSNNTLMVEESHPLPLDTESSDDPKQHNPFAVGYTTSSTPIEHETHLDTSPSTNRIFKIVNESIVNPISGTPVAYKLLPHPSQMLLAHPSSYHSRRSEFTTHALWVTRYRDDELFPSGQHTLQSLGGEGIASWIASRRHHESVVRDRDIVLWHTFGTTHNPRTEDWPVMPSEKMTVGLKPVNFFGRNPGIDVRLSRQEDNRSVLVTSSRPGAVGEKDEEAQAQNVEVEGCCSHQEAKANSKSKL